MTDVAPNQLCAIDREQRTSIVRQERLWFRVPQEMRAFRENKPPAKHVPSKNSTAQLVDSICSGLNRKWRRSRIPTPHFAWPCNSNGTSIAQLVSLLH